MIAVDTNILVYAHREDSAWHEPAEAVVRGLAEGRGAWGIPWPCVHEFLAIVTHPRIYKPPSPLSAALEQVEAWRESPTLSLLGENDDAWGLLKQLVVRSKVRGPQTHDARIVAICRANGVRELWSADRDFSRFAFTVKNPLVS